MYKFFTVTVSALLCVCISGCATTKKSDASARLPNIVVVVVDDMGWADAGFHGSEIRTPTLDALASVGTILERSYVYPVCSPTRAALMTGKNPLRYGIDGAMKNDAALPAGLKLMPEYLKNAGYNTQMVGKWHLGMAKAEYAPDARGFDNFYGMLGGFSDYYNHLYFGGYDLQRDGVSDRTEGYLTDLLTDEAVRVIKNSADEGDPLFLYLAYNAPHTPLQYPPDMAGEYVDFDNRDRQVYAQMLTYWDRSFGEVIQALEKNDMRDNTIIVFLSDNGGLVDGGASNEPLRAGKGSAFEGGIRSPTIISWPGFLGEGMRYDSPVFIQDWLPTLLDAAGVDFDPEMFEGTSKWDSISEMNDKVASKQDPVIIGATKSRAVFAWPYKFVRVFGGVEGPDEEYLFNIVADPTEENNLINDDPARANDMRIILDSVPVGESKGNKGPPPEHLFRNPDGTNNFNYRMEEICAPWAEAARGQSTLPACKG